MNTTIYEFDNLGNEDKSLPVFKLFTEENNDYLCFEAMESSEDSLVYDLNYYIIKKLRDELDDILKNCQDQTSFEQYIKLLRNS